MKFENVIIGMKVVPFKKSTGSKYSKYFDTDTGKLENDRKYLLVTKIPLSDRVVLGDECDLEEKSGDYFLPDDFEPYIENKIKENKMKIKQNFTINTNKAYYIEDSEYNKKDIINLLKYCGYRCITELFENPVNAYRSSLLLDFYGARLLDSKGVINYTGENLDGKLVLAISKEYNNYALFKVGDVLKAIEEEHNKLKAKESSFKVDDLVFVEGGSIENNIGVVTM